YAASTYDPYSDRLESGISGSGPRIVTFAPILQNKELPINEILTDLMEINKNKLETQVEIEFAVTLSRDTKTKHKFSLLQVRPLNISEEKVSIDISKINKESIIIKSSNSMGNGQFKNIKDIVYINPEDFNFKDSRTISREIENINKQMLEENRKYILIGFGRWGSSDPWLGIPVTWSMISNAGVIIEASFNGRPVDMSQGSHFFHNITNLRIPYLCIDDFSDDYLNWNWLNNICIDTNQKIVKRVTLDNPLKIVIDGSTHTGIITK
ncbi:MAG: phosphoenolpyruvate synthase, partial [Spirochaetales bacterium]|nr:phosphoenolpyruvate synthase [Spirochaetales bacterium]